MKENISLQLNEEIKPIQGYEGLYSVTNFGRVWSHIRERKCRCGYRSCGGKFLKGYINKDGYLTIELIRDYIGKSYLVSRLTAIHYIPNPQNLSQVNHKDGNKQNNFVGTKEKSYEDGNLEWCTNRNNINHAMEHDLIRRKRTSRCYGVSLKKMKRLKRCWYSGVSDNGKRIHIGSYVTEIEAAKAYNDYVIEHDLNRPLNKI